MIDVMRNIPGVIASPPRMSPLAPTNSLGRCQSPSLSSPSFMPLTDCVSSHSADA